MSENNHETNLDDVEKYNRLIDEGEQLSRRGKLTGIQRAKIGFGVAGIVSFIISGFVGSETSIPKGGLAAPLSQWTPKMWTSVIFLGLALCAALGYLSVELYSRHHPEAEAVGSASTPRIT